ncbi:endothelin-converting enzyme 1 [Caerostris extrusa]|uniref:Endothelin-converting enzyme 1 n=1 Tax=Caerostris extrusa TaxID=172846 RepID=A0AAV4T763_CAEEX|nr:endothelin-converting enzyme 1 [Caerostris extrusa]
MDPTIEPCDKEHQFACGNYLKLVEQPITPNDTEALLKVKRLYTSCMNISSIEDGSVKVLLELLTDYGIGEWPILNHQWDKPKVDLEWRLAMLHVHQVQPFFHTFVAPDDRNSSVYLLHVYSGSPILNTQYYLNTSDPDYVRYILSYKNLIGETVRLLKAQESIVKRDIEDLLEFEVEFANAVLEFLVDGEVIAEDGILDFLNSRISVPNASIEDKTKLPYVGGRWV